jgi:hypothetical protein
MPQLGDCKDSVNRGLPYNRRCMCGHTVACHTIYSGPPVAEFGKCTMKLCLCTDFHEGKI